MSLLNSRVLLFIGIGSAILALTSLVLLPFLLAAVPADYFVAPPPRPHFPTLRWFMRLGRNLLGALLLLLGVAMLVLPGQGLLTIFAALIVMDFPHKRQLELRILKKPYVLRLVNRIRAHRGQPPFAVASSDLPLSSVDAFKAR